jgi:hypothetical protein
MIIGSSEEVVLMLGDLPAGTGLSIAVVRGILAVQK